jgi:hypothetical protein
MKSGPEQLRQPIANNANRTQTVRALPTLGRSLQGQFVSHASAFGLLASHWFL